MRPQKKRKRRQIQTQMTLDMRQRSKEFIACFLVMLVLTLPLYMADVLADGQISSVKGKGKDNAVGVIRATDALTVEAEIIGLLGAAVPSNLRLGSSNVFDSCSQTVNGSLCRVRFPSSGDQNFDAKEMPFTVTLYEGEAILDTKPGSVVVDNKKPALSFSALSSADVGNEDITFSFTATDTACDDASCSGKCSGIKKIEFFSLDNSFVDTVNVNTRSCTYSCSFVKSSSSFSSGATALYARVYDMVNQVSSTSSISFTADNSGPVILPSSLQILSNGKDIRHFKQGSAVSVTVKVNLSDNSLNSNSVYANLYDLNPSDASLKSSKGSCVSFGNISTCSFSIALKLDTAGVKQLRFNASDNKGNKESAIITRTFSVDSTGPSILALQSAGTTVQGQSFAQSTSDIVAIISESGSGVSSGSMFLNVNGAKISASSCNVTTCVWKSVNLGSGDVDVSIDPSSSDVLGNKALSFSQVFTVNSQAPTIRGVVISSVGGLSGSASQFIKIGDRIGIEANVTEDTQIGSARADLSQFIPGASSVSGNCAYSDGNTFLCSWLSDPVQNAVSGSVTLTITDAAGNSATQSQSAQSYSASNDLDPNLWSSSVSCSPRTLDRQLGPLINQRAYCTVNLERRSTSGTLKTVSTTLSGCTGDQSAILQNAELFNAQPLSTTPLIKLTLKKDQLALSELRTSCTLNIISLQNGAITSNPETEVVPITLQFFDNPLGTLDAGVQADIDEAKAAAEGIWGMIGVLKDIMTVLSKICQLMGILANLMYLGYFIALKMSVSDSIVCDTAYSAWWTGGLTFKAYCNPVTSTSTVWCKAQQAQEEITGHLFGEIGKKACGFVNCQWTGVDFIDEWKAWNNEWYSKLGPLNAEYFVGGEYSGGYFAAVKDADGKSTGFTKNSIDPKQSIILSVLFACIPGIIENLDKMRQIECLRADCLQTAVVEDNVPITVCDNLYSQAWCKYVVGEIFALIPYTALYKAFIEPIRAALLNPFGLLQLGAIAYCYGACLTTYLDFGANYQVCEGVKVASKLGEIIGQVKGVLDQGFSFFENQENYCDRLEGVGGKK